MALLKILEGWLDEATQKQLRTQLEAQTDLRFQEFMSQLCREFDFVPSRQERNKWRDTKIKLEGGAPHVCELAQIQDRPPRKFGWCRTSSGRRYPGALAPTIAQRDP